MAHMRNFKIGTSLLRAICLGFVAALGDLAVASFPSDPFVRWSGIIAVAAYVALATLTWRRAASLGAASGALVLAGLIALGEFVLTPSDPNGVRFTGTTSPVALALLVAAALFLCAVAAALSKARTIVRVVVPIVALAGITPFFLAAREGTLDTAFGGALGWIGWADVEIVLPLAALAVAFVAARDATRKRWVRAATALTLSFAVVASVQAGSREAGTREMPSLTAFEGSPDRSLAIAVEPTPAAGPSSTGSSQSAARCLPRSAAGASGSNDVGNTVANAFGGAFAKSPAPQPAATMAVSVQAESFRASARNIPCETYDVVALASTLPQDYAAIDAFVRDHVGTESYPGALRGALGTWMGRSGNPTDKAILLATLLRAKGYQCKFVSSALSDAELNELRVAETAVPEAFPSDNAQASGMSPNDANLQQSTAAVNAVIASAQTQADAIVAALASHGIHLANDASPAPDSERDHWWVKVDDGGRDVDLDPSAPALQPGRHFGQTPGTPTDDLPDALYATIQVRIVGVFGEGPSAQELELAGVRARTADLSGSPIRLAILPQKGEADPANATTFLPHFGLGDDIATGPAFELTDSRGARLSEIRLEISTTQPNRPNRTYRRWIVTNDQARDADVGARISGLATILVQDGPVNFNFGIATMLDADAQIADYVANPAMNLGRLVYPIRGLRFFLQDAAAGVALAQKYGVAFQYDRPRIVLQRVAYDRRDGKTVMSDGFDIVENGLAARGDRGAYANVIRGAADTEIERDVSGLGATGAIDLLAAAPNALRLLRTLPSAQARYLGLEQTFERGAVAVALASDSPGDQIGWWDVDPQGGTTVGRVTGGAGQSLVEYGFYALNVFLETLTIRDAYAKCTEGSSAIDCFAAICSAIVGAVFLAASVSSLVSAANKATFFGPGGNATALFGGAKSIAPGFFFPALCGGS